MKKRLLIGLLACLMVLALMGCQAQSKATVSEVKWTVEIVGAEVEKIDNNTLQELELVELTADLKKKDGSIKTQTWKGYKLSDIVTMVNAKDYTSITVEADDGYNAEYTPEIAMDPETILGIERDGEEREKPMMVAKNQRGNFWIKNTVKLTFNK